MLKELQNYAIKVLEETNTKHKIRKNFTEDNRHVSDTIFVKELPNKLKEIGYYLSVKKNQKGYYFICQPTIPHCQGQPYGFIPEDLLQQITN
ncbi:hypothetical protein [Aquimarina aggregata]|uniref:hypothetical protein n=1 Tax=Aquimarina aggregata TaxID=1642818 RepID=UPI002491ED51|nr:hypothetical protein [Aquimarina aggregata]